MNKFDKEKKLVVNLSMALLKVAYNVNATEGQ